MKVSIKGFITCKIAEEYIDCADNYAVNKSIHRFAVSDGVSKSFFPKIWSEILVSHFVEESNIKERGELTKVCQKKWQDIIDEKINLPETKWHTRTLYNRKEPALATFVGLQFFEGDKSWSAWAQGDSFLFFVPEVYMDYQKDLIKLSSKAEPIIFDNFPDFVSSIGNNHKGELVSYENQKIVNGTFYLMTDALAEWFINQGENASGKITVWQTQGDFERFISQAVDEEELTNDDCAILCIEISEADKSGIEYKKIEIMDLFDLINNQEAEKVNQNNLEEEKIKEQRENQKNKELETLHLESTTFGGLETEIKEESKEGFLMKIQEFLSGKEKVKLTEIVSSENEISSEFEEIKEQKSEVAGLKCEGESSSDAEGAEPAKNEKEKSEELTNEEIEREDKTENEGLNIENLQIKEQKKVDSTFKNIFDKF